MSWIKLSDDWAGHPKFTDPGTGPLRQLLHARSLCYAGRYLTDGFIPSSMLPSLLTGFEALAITHGIQGQDASELDWPTIMIEAALWDATEGGWQIHDYLTYNPSKKQVEIARKMKSQGGQHSQQIQLAKRLLQGQHSRQDQASVKQSPVPVPKRKKETLKSGVDSGDNPRSHVLASPSTDREVSGTGFGTPNGISDAIKALIPPEIAKEIESDLIVQPE